MTDGNGLPALVALELGEREPTGHLEVYLSCAEIATPGATTARDNVVATLITRLLIFIAAPPDNGRRHETKAAVGQL